MFVVNVLYGLLLFFMHVQTDLFWAIIGHGLSSTLLSLLVAVPFFVLAGSALSQGGFSARSAERAIRAFARGSYRGC